MNDRLMIAAMHAAGRAANSDLLTSNEQVEASKSLRFADALIAAAGEGGDPALHENCVGVAIHNVIVDRIQGERDNAICRLTDRDAQVATLQAKVARLERQLEPLTRDELVEDGEARAYWCGMTVTNVLELTKQIDRIRARRGE